MRILNFLLTRTKNVLPQEKLAAARKIVLESCDFVVDIGANNGQWMTHVRDHGYKGYALSIEPLKRNFRKLQANKSHNTIAINCAVGNKNSYVYINQASNDGLSSSILELGEHHINAAPGIKYTGKEKVKISKLSKLLKDYTYKKIYVKIDTQGYEFEVLKSMSKENFNRVYAFEIETSLVSTYKKVTLIEDVIKFLRNKGYQPVRVESGFGMPNFGQQLQVDIIFIKSEQGIP